MSEWAGERDAKIDAAIADAKRTARRGGIEASAAVADKYAAEMEMMRAEAIRRGLPNHASGAFRQAGTARGVAAEIRLLLDVEVDDG